MRIGQPGAGATRTAGRSFFLPWLVLSPCSWLTCRIKYSASCFEIRLRVDVAEEVRPLAAEVGQEQGLSTSRGARLSSCLV